ncbi:MAG: hypothetical protein ACT4O2_12500, partial [Beijerinckiaceae bacterium]
APDGGAAAGRRRTSRRNTTPRLPKQAFFHLRRIKSLNSSRSPEVFETGGRAARLRLRRLAGEFIFQGSTEGEFGRRELARLGRPSLVAPCTLP